MTSKPTWISRLRSLLGGRKKPQKAEPLRPVREPRKRTLRTIEPLEGRIAPATVIDAYTIGYTDLDGDLVTVKFSKALFGSASTTLLNDIFKFSDGPSSVPFESDGPQYLQLIDLTRTPLVSFETFLRAADGTSITVTATIPEDGTGDGLTSVGGIEAAGIALGHVKIDGDLGQIDAGRGGAGVKSLTVHSLFKLGNATQVTTGTAADRLESTIAGRLGRLEVATDVYGYVNVVDGTVFFNDRITPGSIGEIIIGGSLRGKDAVETASNNTGTIQSKTSIGSIQVLGMNDPSDPDDAAGLVGGGGSNSGSIIAGTKIGSVTIADSLTGGGGLNSGSIISKGTISKLTVGNLRGGVENGSGSIQAATLTKGTITGTIVGGEGDGSGSVTVTKTIGNLSVAGNVSGGEGDFSGSISAVGAIKTIKLSANLEGGEGFRSGAIHSGKSLGKIAIDGNVIGGDGERSASIGTDGSITSFNAGKLVGGDGANSGSVYAGIDPLLRGVISSAVVREGIIGGEGVSSGTIVGAKLKVIKVGSATQGASIEGGIGNFSGSIVSSSTIGSVTVYGNVQGGVGDYSGTLQSRTLFNKATITGDLQGGGGDFSGSVRAVELVDENFSGLVASLGTIIIQGGIIGGSGSSSGLVEASGNLASLTAATLTSGTAQGSGSVRAGAGWLGAGNAKSVTITGAMSSTTDDFQPAITAQGNISRLTIGSMTNATVALGGNLLNAIVKGNVDESTITAAGLPLNAAAPGTATIGKLSIRGNVTESSVMAGYSIDGFAVNADASIGAVSVTGDWTASDLVAGVMDADGNGFGSADDVVITGGIDRVGTISRIASIVIQGTLGGGAGADTYGITAQKIGFIKAGGANLGLDTKAGNQTLQIPGTNVVIREVPA